MGVLQRLQIRKQRKRDEVAKATTDGKVYGSDFIGPLRPQDTRVNVPDVTLNRETQQSSIGNTGKPNFTNTGGNAINHTTNNTINITQEQQAKIDKFAQEKAIEYQNKADKQVQNIAKHVGNWKQLTTFQRNKYIEKAYGKAQSGWENEVSAYANWVINEKGGYSNENRLSQFGETSGNTTVGFSSLDNSSNIQKSKGKEFLKGVWETTGGYVRDIGKGFAYRDPKYYDKQIRKYERIFKEGDPMLEKLRKKLKEEKKLAEEYNTKKGLTKEQQRTFQITAVGVPLSLTGGLGSGIVKTAYTGAVGYQGYQTFREPNAQNLGMLTGMVIVPEVINKGMKSVRVREGYNKALKDLEGKFGSESPQVKEFRAMWERAFNELPRQVETKQWSSAQVEKAWGDVKIQSITNDVMRKYKPKVIGSTTIKPQTTLKELPRGKAGDVDIQQVGKKILGISTNKEKKLALELTQRLREQGYNARMRESPDNLNEGRKAYHITIDGKEFVNIHGSSDYFLRTQAGPLINWYEFEKIGAWSKDPYGIRMGNIRDQMRVKLWKGFVEKSRAKDITDARGIYEGTSKYKKIKNMKDGILGKEKTSFKEKELRKLYEDRLNDSKYSLDKYNTYKAPYSRYGKYNKGNYNYKKDGYKIDKPYKLNSPYKSNVPYKPEQPIIKPPYTPNNPYTPYTPYSPEEPILPIIPNKAKDKPRKIILLSSKKKDKTSFKPIYITKQGKILDLGKSFLTSQQAYEEGMRNTDELPVTKFKVVRSSEKGIKGRPYLKQYKFKNTRLGMREITKYQKDSPMERRSGFQWTQMLRN